MGRARTMTSLPWTLQAGGGSSAELGTEPQGWDAKDRGQHRERSGCGGRPGSISRGLVSRVREVVLLYTDWVSQAKPCLCAPGPGGCPHPLCCPPTGVSELLHRTPSCPS